MLGAIGGLIGSVVGGGSGGGLLGGLLGGGKGGGLMGGISQIAGKLLDPLGIMGGKQEQHKCNSSEDLKEMVKMMKEMFQELMAMIKEEKGSKPEGHGEGCRPEGPPGFPHPIHVSTGEGDDTVNVNQCGVCK